MKENKLFYLQRNEDFSGVSGTGIVAYGIEFWDGTCVMHWDSAHTSTAVYASIEELETIHGHEGRTRVVWIDETNQRGTR